MRLHSQKISSRLCKQEAHSIGEPNLAAQGAHSLNKGTTSFKSEYVVIVILSISKLVIRRIQIIIVVRLRQFSLTHRA